VQLSKLDLRQFPIGNFNIWLGPWYFCPLKKLKSAENVHSKKRILRRK